jgi:hypothetical protein
MKKLFKYEINESIAAKAAMNCVHKRLFKELYMGRPGPQEEVVNGDYDPYEWEFDDYGNEDKRKLIIQALVQAGLIQSEQEGVQLNNKIQQLLDKSSFSVSDAQDAMTFVKSYGQQIVGGAQEQEEDGINKGGMHDTFDSEWFSDREEQDAYDDAFRLIAELAADQIDRENLDAKGIENNMDTLFDITKEVWKKDSIDLIDFMLSEVDEDECQNFFDEHYEEIKDEYMKREHNNIMDATHDDLFASENEEEDYSNDSQGIEMIIDLMVAKHMISDSPKIRQIAQKLIERKLNEEGMWIGEDDHEAERFVSFFGEDLVEEIAHWRW